jgi:DNA modification methylase
MLKSDQKTTFEILGRGPIHPFPARMAPGIALDVLRVGGAKQRVLDPMAGSGTVLAVARAKGHRAFGFDVDPLAVLLARVWTRALDHRGVEAATVRVLARARRLARLMRIRNGYPEGSDPETRSFIRYWFDSTSRRQLAALAKGISIEEDDAIRDVLWCGLSRLIIVKSSGASLAMDLAHSRPHKAFLRAPIEPFEHFASRVEAVVNNCLPASGSQLGPRSVVRLGDARQLQVADATIDVVLTSPPYLNGIDYLRCSKFSLVWMGYPIKRLREIRTGSVGSEAAQRDASSSEWVKTVLRRLRLSPALSTRDTALLSRYAWDMKRALAETHRVLKPRGRAVYVVGESTSRGTFIKNSAIVAAAAQESGLSIVSRHTRTLPADRRYLPPPRRSRDERAKLDARLRREVVLEFVKG